MAKSEKPEVADVNPQLAFEAAWDKNEGSIREVLTRTHQVRGNLKPSQIKRANEILTAYGL